MRRYAKRAQKTKKDWNQKQEDAGQDDVGTGLGGTHTGTQAHGTGAGGRAERFPGASCVGSLGEPCYFSCRQCMLGTYQFAVLYIHVPATPNAGRVRRPFPLRQGLPAILFRAQSHPFFSCAARQLAWTAKRKNCRCRVGSDMCLGHQILSVSGNHNTYEVTWCHESLCGHTPIVLCVRAWPATAPKRMPATSG